MAHTMIADLTVEELRTIIREVVMQTLQDALQDPDQGLELRPEMEHEIQQALTSADAAENTVAAEELAARLGLDW